MGDMLVRDSTNRILQVNPTLTYAEIGRLLGVSRERIRQIAGQHRRTPKACKVCGRKIQVRHSGVTQTAYRLRYCADCWSQAMQKRREAHLVQCACEVCGKTFSRTEGTVRRMERRGHRVRWCSRRCQGRWLGGQQGSDSNDQGQREPSRV